MTITARFTPKTTGPIAEAVIEFHGDCGPLAGFELGGFAIWNGKDGKFRCTVPSRQSKGPTGETKYWDYLRLQSDAAIPDSQKWAVKNWLISEYEKSQGEF